MRPITKILLFVISTLLLAVGVLGYMYHKNRAEAKRQTANVAQLMKLYDQELVLTREEFSKAQTAWKLKTDSLLKANKIALNKVKSATIINTEYRDTGIIVVVSDEPVRKQDKSYLIPVSYSSPCWGVFGQILTSDPAAKLQIDARMADNSVQMLVTRKRFLGFLWWRKDEKFRAWSDCGQVNFTKIDFVNK